MIISTAWTIAIIRGSRQIPFCVDHRDVQGRAIRIRYAGAHQWTLKYWKSQSALARPPGPWPSKLIAPPCRWERGRAADMSIVVFIVLTILIGWAVPRFLVPRLPDGMAVVVASLIALAVGVGVIWIGAQLFDAAGIEDATSAFERGFNAWKIMLLIAPAVAIHTRRNLAKETE